MKQRGGAPFATNNIHYIWSNILCKLNNLRGCAPTIVKLTANICPKLDEN